MRKMRKFEIGGMASDDEALEAKYKAAGLAASNAENKKSSGFFGRFGEGNIDEKGSEAYNKYGAGYGRKIEAENTRLKEKTEAETKAPAETKLAAPAAPAETKLAAPAAAAKYRNSSDYSDTASMKSSQGSATEPKMERRNLSVPNAAGPSTTPEIGDKGARDTSSFKKPAAKAPAPAETKMERRNLSVPNAAGPSAKAPAAPAETKMERRNLSVPNAAGPSAKAPETAKPAEKQLSQAQQRAQAAVARAMGNSSGVASGRVPTTAEAERNRANFAGKVGETVSSVGNYFKNFETPAERRSRLAKEAKSSQKAGGGAIRGYASGGTVSASSRGDGIAQRGKTRGKMC